MKNHWNATLRRKDGFTAGQDGIERPPTPLKLYMNSIFGSGKGRKGGGGSGASGGGRGKRPSRGARKGGGKLLTSKDNAESADILEIVPMRADGPSMGSVGERVKRRREGSAGGGGSSGGEAGGKQTKPTTSDSLHAEDGDRILDWLTVRRGRSTTHLNPATRNANSNLHASRLFVNSPHAFGGVRDLPFRTPEPPILDSPLISPPRGVAAMGSAECPPLPAMTGFDDLFPSF